MKKKMFVCGSLETPVPIKSLKFSKLTSRIVIVDSNDSRTIDFWKSPYHKWNFIQYENILIDIY